MKKKIMLLSFSVIAFSVAGIAQARNSVMAVNKDSSFINKEIINADKGEKTLPNELRQQQLLAKPVLLKQPIRKLNFQPGKL